MLAALDHVQIAAPAGSKDEMRASYIYIDALGMEELPKPPALAARGGCWFGADEGRIQIHVGIESGFRPATKAHPGLRVTGIHLLAKRLGQHGAPVVWDDKLPGHLRFYSVDPVDNRIEFLESRF
jgi:hypothetical protein